jgi:hypothetical protein
MEVMFFILAQVPGSEMALELASKRGYETYILCIVLLACIGLVGMLFRWFIASFDNRAKESVAREESRVKEGVDRENRLAERINALETFVQDTLMVQVQATTSALHENMVASTALAEALRAKTCLLEPNHQDRLIQGIAGHLSATLREKSSD